MLGAAGWVVQDYRSVNLYAGTGVAVRELVTTAGPADYVLFVNCQAVGVIEAKKRGTTLSGVEVECTVCITYRGRTDCRVAAGPTRETALDSATQMACAQLASGRAESLECDRTPPTRSECREP